jgi:membrane-bound lytic murein transglycosylase F
VNLIRFKHIIFKLFLILFLFSCSEKEVQKSKIIAVEGLDLPQLIKRGKLVILAENSSTSYFVYRGKKMGFEYELLTEFAHDLGIELEIKTISNFDDMNRQLNVGEADIIACNYTITKNRQEEIDFSIPFLRTCQVLIQRKPDNYENLSTDELKRAILFDPIQLAHKKIYVWKNSSYYQRLLHLQEEIGDSILIQGETGDVTSEELIEQVSEGKIDYTVTEKNIAIVNQRFYENLDVNLELSVRQKIGFAIRKTSPLLKARLNQWLTQYMQKSSFRYMKHKYFELSKLTDKSKGKFSSLIGGQISAYDAIFKKEAAKNNWDWHLIAAIAYQESKFDPYVTGYGGSYGMMQFMPEVGPKFGVYPNSTPEVQIAGGMKKIVKDYNSWSEVKDKVQRQKFALASYNAGLSHIKDAQRLAKKYGLDPTKWDGNVEEMVKNLSQKKYYQDEVVENGAMRGPHTQKYVISVFTRFMSYKSTFK